MTVIGDHLTMNTNAITREVIGAAMRVHTALGPGLLESAYRACLCRELELCDFVSRPKWPCRSSIVG